MSAYAMGYLTIHHRDWMEEYSAKIGDVIGKHSGKVIARGEPQWLEGNEQLPHIAIVIEFPDQVAAKGWYNDPDNQALVKLRQTGSQFDLVLVNGA